MRITAATPAFLLTLYRHLLSLTAKQHNIEEVVAQISRKSYASLTETLGVSMIINPVDMCASNILRFIQKDGIVIFSQLIQGQAEFIEVWAERGMPLTEKTLLDLDIPRASSSPRSTATTT